MTRDDDYVGGGRTPRQLLLACLHDDIESLETLQMHCADAPASDGGGLSRKQMWDVLRPLIDSGRVDVLEYDGKVLVPVRRECIKESEREEYWFALAQRQ